MSINKLFNIFGLSLKSNKRNAAVCVLLAVVPILLLGIGCGGGTSSSSTVPANVVNDVAALITSSASTNLVGGPGAAISHPTDHVEPQTASCNQSSCVISEQFNSSYACQLGGNIGFAGDINGTINNSGNGSIQFQVDETFTNCIPDAGYTVNGAPEVTVGGTFTFNNGNLSFPLQILEGGAVKINNQTCNINLTTLAESNGSSTTTGSLCGQSVSISVQ